MDSFYKKPKGVQDIYYPRSIFYLNFRNIVDDVMRKNNYDYIIPPSFECKEFILKSLGLGINSTKEIFSFSDKKNRNFSLRPEGTSSIARMILENKLISKNNPIPLKIYYFANMFRYERPQKNRYREFWQLGVELVNSQKNAISDFHILNLANELLINIHLNDYFFEINYLGDSDLKKKYEEVAKKEIFYKEKYLCYLCKKRYSSNTFFAILDCEICNSIFSLPSYDSFWSFEDRKYFDNIRDMLKESKIPFIFNNRLFRGLNYYTGIIFEVNIKDERTLLGGGRYDNLYEEISFGKRKINSSGFAIGVDRVINFLINKNVNSPVLKLKKNKIDIFFFVSKNIYYYDAIKIQTILKENNIIADYNLEIISEKKISFFINSLSPKFLLFFNSDYDGINSFKIKNLINQESLLIKKNEIINYIIYKMIKKNISGLSRKL